MKRERKEEMKVDRGFIYLFVINSTAKVPVPS